MKGSGPWVLGIAASQHNGAACLMRGDEIVAAVQEERVTRLKRQGVNGSRPSAAIAYCLDTAGIETGDLDSVVLCTQKSRDDPDHDVGKNPQLAQLARRGRLSFIPHHLGHALSVLAWAGYEDAAILVVDGCGSPWADLPANERLLAAGNPAGLSETISMYKARGWQLHPVEKHFAPTEEWLRVGRGGLPSYRSLGGMYAAVALRIFGDALEAGKVMGLAPYAAEGIADEEFLSIDESGIKFPDDLPTMLREIRSGHPDDHASKCVSASVQAALERALLYLTKRLRARTGAANLCFAGGVALNAIANERVLREAGFDAMQVIPAADDGGTAYGAAIDGLLRLGFPVRKQSRQSDGLGRNYHDGDILQAASRFSGLSVSRPEDIASATAERIARGRICGWFQGGSEFGPRALGHRSILADARSSLTKVRLDTTIKRREPFRPYAPVALQADAGEWFDVGPDPESPFMLRVVTVRKHKRKLVPAIVHVDGTARLQTVSPRDGKYYRVLEHYKRLTSVPVLLNTSFNDHGEPIVETPCDALDYFMSSDLDFCVIGDRLFEKQAGSLQRHNNEMRPS